MNNINLLEVTYITNNKTIETIILESNGKITKVIYVYNYKHQHFRVFDNLIELLNFLDNENCKIIAEYRRESALDKYLTNVDLLKYY